MTPKTPASDLAAAMTGESVGGVSLTSGTNLFFRRLHPDPLTMAVYLIDSGGEAPSAYVHGTTAEATFRARVVSTVYGPPGEDGFELGESLARGVHGFFHQQAISGYIAVYALEGGPSHNVDVATQRHVFTSSFEAVYNA